MDLKSRLDEALELYDMHRFIDAFRVIEPAWRLEALEGLAIEQLLDASRLAYRVGGTRISRRLQRQALRMAPDHPLVRYFFSPLSLFFLWGRNSRCSALGGGSVEGRSPGPA